MQKQYEVVLLAGGIGSRLSPITDTLPKPLVPVCNEPVLTRLTKQLSENGWSEALLTVCAMPDVFDRYKDQNLRLHTVKGAFPLGSAGCVKENEALLAENFLVLSGDAVLLPNEPNALRTLYETHCREHRLVTVLLSRQKDPGEFGIVSLDGDRIRSFSEKPSWRDTFSDLVSTGIYILHRSVLDHIPKDLFFDFGKDLFPRLLTKDVPLHGMLFPGKWWDIGTLSSYYLCSMFLSNETNIIGEECLCGDGALIEKSILLDRATVGKNAYVSGSILCPGAEVGEGCYVPAGCVIGAHTVLEPGVRLRPGTHIASRLTVRSPQVFGERFRFGTVGKRYFGEETISGTLSEYDSSFCVRLGRALNGENGSRKIGVLHTSGAKAQLFAELLSRGARDAGATVWELGNAFPAVTSFAVRQYGLDLAVCVEVNESLSEVTFTFRDRDGLPLSREEQRTVASRLNTDRFASRVTPFEAHIPTGEERVLLCYCKYLQEAVGGLHGVTFSVARKDETGEFLGANASEIGAKIFYGEEDGTDSFTVSPNGTRACAFAANGKPLTYWHLVALVAADSPRDTVVLPDRVPKTVEEYLRKMGKEIRFYSDGNDPDRANAKRDPYVSDGVLLCLLVAKQMQARNCSLSELCASLPEFSVRKKELPATESDAEFRAARIAALTQNGCRKARVERPNGCVTVYPNASGGYTLLAESTFGGLSAIDELCAEAERLLGEM